MSFSDLQRSCNLQYECKHWKEALGVIKNLCLYFIVNACKIGIIKKATASVLVSCALYTFVLLVLSCNMKYYFLTDLYNDPHPNKKVLNSNSIGSSLGNREWPLLVRPRLELIVFCLKNQHSHN